MLKSPSPSQYSSVAHSDQNGCSSSSAEQATNSLLHRGNNLNQLAKHTIALRTATENYKNVAETAIHSHTGRSVSSAPLAYPAEMHKQSIDIDKGQELQQKIDTAKRANLEPIRKGREELEKHVQGITFKSPPKNRFLKRFFRGRRPAKSFFSLAQHTTALNTSSTEEYNNVAETAIHSHTGRSVSSASLAYPAEVHRQSIDKRREETRTEEQELQQKIDIEEKATQKFFQESTEKLIKLEKDAKEIFFKSPPKNGFLKHFFRGRRPV